MKTATVTIEGMSCGGCVAGVRKALGSVAGVELISVEVGRVELRFDPAKTDEDALRGAVDAAGFDVRAVDAR
jgi:copper chaperone